MSVVRKVRIKRSILKSLRHTAGKELGYALEWANLFKGVIDSNEDTKNVSVKINDEVYKQAVINAKELNMTVTEYMCICLEKYIERCNELDG